MIDPIDYQHSFERTQIVEKIEQARKEIPQIEKDQFIKELTKQNAEDATRIKETQESNSDLKVKEEKEKERKKKEEEARKKREEAKQEASDFDKDNPNSGHLIDIEA